MKKIKKLCKNCGKCVYVDQYEYCCPNCGEFFEDISNETVLMHHENERIEGINDELKDSNKRHRSSANKEAFKAWGIGIPIMYIAIGVIAFLSSMSEIADVVGIVLMVIGGLYITLVPILIPIVNKLRYDRKLLDQVAINDHSIIDEKRLKGRSFFSGFCMFMSICLLVLPILVMVDPIIVFKHIHYGWVVGVICGFSLLIILLSLVPILSYGRTYFNEAENSQKRVIITVKIKGYIAVVGVVVSLLCMLIGIFTIPNKTFTICNVQEFNILANMPYVGECNYTLGSDLDFKGASSKAYGSIKEFNGVFDGNGHYIKNLNFSGESVAHRGAKESGVTPKLMGLVLYNRGEIKNLNFKNCTFETYMTGSGTNSCGVLAGQNSGKINNCNFIDTYIKCYHRHSYYSKKYNVLNCDDDFGYIVGRNAMGDRAQYSNTRVYGKITNINVSFNIENQAFLSKLPSGYYEDGDIYIIKNIFGDENITSIDNIGFLNKS